MEWVQHDIPVREDLNLYLCHTDCGNVRILRHNKPCFNNMYMLFYVIKEPHNQYTFTHQIAKLINMEEEELEKIIVNEYNAKLVKSMCYWPKGKDISHQIHFKNLKDLERAAEWLFSIELMNNIVGE